MIGTLAAAEREGLQHPRQAEDVIGVQVREEDVLEVDEPGVRAEQLALRPLAAVDEQPVAAAAEERRGGAARGGRGAEPTVPRKTRSRSTGADRRRPAAAEAGRRTRAVDAPDEARAVVTLSARTRHPVVAHDLPIA